jgi:PAS domain S-box-containing protein
MLVALWQNEVVKPIETKIIHYGSDRLIDIELSGRVIKINGDEFVQLSFQDISLRKMFFREQVRAKIAEETNIVLENEIVERKKVELKLLSEQEYKKSLIESSLDVIISTNVENQIVQFNQAAINIFGYSRQEILGKPIQTLFFESLDFQKFYSEIIENKQFKGELILKRKDGRMIDSYLTSSPIIVEGDSVGLICIIREIGEQKKQALELRESEERFRVLYNQAFIGIARISKTGRFILVNHRVCSITGYSRT